MPVETSLSSTPGPGGGLHGLQGQFRPHRTKLMLHFLAELTQSKMLSQSAVQIYCLLLSSGIGTVHMVNRRSLSTPGNQFLYIGKRDPPPPVWLLPLTCFWSTMNSGDPVGAETWRGVPGGLVLVVFGGILAHQGVSPSNGETVVTTSLRLSILVILFEPLGLCVQDQEPGGLIRVERKMKGL